MGKGETTKDVTSGKADLEKELDYENAIGMAAEQPGIQDSQGGTEAETLQQEVKTCEDSGQTGIVGILEGLGVLNLEPEGTGNMNHAEFLNALQAEQAAQAGDEVEADLPKVEAPVVQQEQSAVAEKPAQPETVFTGPLENINSEEDAKVSGMEQAPEADSLEAMLHNAAQRAGKGRQTDTGAQEEPKPELAETTASTAQPQQASRAEAPEFAVASQEHTPTTRTEAMAENITRMVESIEVHAAQGTQEFTMQLKPESLGKLSIKLIMDDDGIRAQIKANELSSKSLILNELPALEETLKEKGIEVKQIEVAYEAPKFDFNFKQGSQNNAFAQGGGSSRHYTPILEQDTAVSFFEMASGLEYFTQSSSMEFHA